jgi:DNA polymerase-4
MPMFRARHLCPELVVVDLRMEHYRSVSQQIRAILETHTELIEPLALDEFYLDVSATTASIAEAGALARHMKEEIRSGTGSRRRPAWRPASSWRRSPPISESQTVS